MKPHVTALLALLLVVSVIPAISGVQAQGGPQVSVKSGYYLNRYGFAVVNETISFYNNESAAVQAPSITVGLGNLSGSIADFNFTGVGFTVSRVNSTSGDFVVGGSPSVAAGATAKVTVSVLLQNVVTVSSSKFKVLVLASPSLSLKVDSLLNFVQMPGYTQLSSAPTGMGTSGAGSNTSYSSTRAKVGPQAASTSARVVKAASSATTQDFHIVKVYSATRSISTGSDGLPVVTDTLVVLNMGPTALSTLYISPLTTSSSSVTILPTGGPRLLSAQKVALSGNGITFTANSAIGNPVPAGSNLSISYSYPLLSRFYSASGGQVSVTIPTRPPIPTFVQSYSILSNLPLGVKLTAGSSQSPGGLSPWARGQNSLAYSLSVGWAADGGVPASAIIFILLLVGLYVSRSSVTTEEETEEESSTEMATAMVTAFDEKTSLINEVWPAVEGEDVNNLDKKYFDDVRGRMDSFRSRAVQRLNEMRQMSATAKFSDLLNQIQTTEREVDRAAKDKLNLYEQYYTKRMRKEVFDRLLPQYTKRLERALNQLSDELHLVQREAKLL